MPFDFKDLTYNAAAAPETTKTKAADPRRNNSYDYLYSAVAMAYAKNRLPGLYPGIIVGVRAANSMSVIAANKAVVPGVPQSAISDELIDWDEHRDTLQSLHIYKVVNIILNPLPYPISYRDPLLLHYPDFDAVNATQTLPIGMLVQLDYHSDDHLKGGRIVQEGPVIDLGWGDMSGMMMSLQDIWSQKPSKPIKQAQKKAGRKTAASPFGLATKPLSGGAPAYEAIQIHYTVTHNTKNAIAVLAERGLSYHYIIDNDGAVTMTVDPQLALAKHAGGDIDRTSIGISFSNLGDDSQWAGKTYTGVVKPPLSEWEEFPAGSGKYWEPYPQVQILAGRALVQQLMQAFPNIKYIYGHEEQTTRKSDPGPAFDKYWPRFEHFLPRGKAPSPYKIATRNRSPGGNA